MTAGIGGAEGEQPFQRLVRVAAVISSPAPLGGHGGAQHRRAHARRIPPQIFAPGHGAVRRAVEIDRLVPQPGPHVVQIRHRDGRRVEGDVGARGELVAAAPHRRHRQGRTEQRLGIVAVAEQVALERVGAAGPALVHEHDVAVRPHLGKGLGVEVGQVAGGLPGAALEDEQRVRSARAAGRRQDHDAERDLASTRGGAVLEDLQDAATRRPAQPRQLARLERHRGLGGAERDGERESEGEKVHTVPTFECGVCPRMIGSGARLGAFIHDDNPFVGEVPGADKRDTQAPVGRRRRTPEVVCYQWTVRETGDGRQEPMPPRSPGSPSRPRNRFAGWRLAC